MDYVLLNLVNWNRVDFVVDDWQSVNFVVNYWYSVNLVHNWRMDDLMTTVVDNLAVLGDRSLGWDGGVCVDRGVDDWDNGMDNMGAAVVDVLA